MDDAYRRAGMLRSFFRFLTLAVIVYAFIIVLCVWEFTIGIKYSIKKLYRGNIMLDNCRYSAILETGLKDSNEPTKHSQTDPDHSRLDRGELH